MKWKMEGNTISSSVSCPVSYTHLDVYKRQHESFAAAEGAIGIAEKANKVRQKPLRVILNGLGKDAAQIISRINGFTYVETKYDYKEAKLNVVYEKPYSNGLRATVKCYGADAVSYTHLDVYKRQMETA